MTAIEWALKELHETREIIDSLSRDLYESIEGMQADYEHRKKPKRREKTDDVTLFTKKFEAYTQKMSINMSEVRDKRLGREGDTLLHSAARVGIMPIVAFLIEQGADVNAIDSSRTQLTPILKAFLHGHFEVAYLLAHNGANLKCRDANGRNILHYIAERNSASAALHIAKNFGLNVQDVMELANQRHTYDVAYNIAVKSDVDLKSAEGKILASALVVGNNPRPEKIVQGAHKIAFQRKKSLPEDVAPTKSLVQEVLIAFRESGQYITRGQAKISESLKRADSPGKRRGARSPGIRESPESVAVRSDQVSFSESMPERLEENSYTNASFET